MLNQLIRSVYGLDAQNIEKATVGAGSDTYFVTCAEGKYVLKFASDSAINHPEQEPQLCAYLEQQGLPVSRFVKALDGSYFGKDETGRRCTLQAWMAGRTPAWNTASDALLWEQAELLGKIHTALKDYPGLPVGIGADFFSTMTPGSALKSYDKSLMTASLLGDTESEYDLLYRIDLMNAFPQKPFDLSRLTCGPTHGDYYISQFLCDGDRINAVIDWTCACVHPLVWEVARSYVYAAPECAKGIFDEKRFAEYTAHYEKFAPLNDYDKQCAKALYFYQIAVCDYYGQYYASKAGNRDIYMKQAVLATKLLRREYPSY